VYERSGRREAQYLKDAEPKEDNEKRNARYGNTDRLEEIDQLHIECSDCHA
jgi:hypothetical protein